MNKSSEGRPEPAEPKNIVFGSLSGFLAFGFGSGLSPLAPGTVGTLLAIPFALGLKTLDASVFWVVLVVLFIIGVRVCASASKKIGTHDHAGIVWDEMVGYWLAVAFIPVQWSWLLAAFLLFRFFDIIKPWPIRELDKRVKGGFGIMIDDVFAAIFTIVVLALVQYFVRN